MKKRHQLKILGITYNQIESGVYAVILEEVNGRRRIPIVIGYPEAQAIECRLQDVKTPRPLSHDLMKDILDSFGMRLSCVDIRKLPNGVFAADLLIEDAEGEMRKIDARSSDALALAIRTGSPVFTSAEVLDEAGFLPKEQSAKTGVPSPGHHGRNASEYALERWEDVEMFVERCGAEGIDPDAELLRFLNNFPHQEIEQWIGRYASEEKYEIAAKIKSLLKTLK